MQIPFFFHTHASPGELITLDETTSRHIVQVLRMQGGGIIQLTNGEGMLWSATITETGKKKCVVHIEKEEKKERLVKRLVSIGIAPVKNSSRLEWFIEKATELGVAEIWMLQTKRTEKQHLRFERLVNISISAMLQSRQVWLPKIVPPGPFEKILSMEGYTDRFIAHCIEEEKLNLSSAALHAGSNCLLLIGPEGDFTSEEISLSLEAGFKPVSLGNTRLRTETAGITGAVLLCQI